MVIEGAFQATLAAAACAARATRQRVNGTMQLASKSADVFIPYSFIYQVKVYLTALGSGAFGNPEAWVAEAITGALQVYRDEPLDVSLVHFGMLRLL